MRRKRGMLCMPHTVIVAVVAAAAAAKPPTISGRSRRKNVVMVDYKRMVGRGRVCVDLTADFGNEDDKKSAMTEKAPFTRLARNTVEKRRGGGGNMLTMNERLFLTDLGRRGGNSSQGGMLDPSLAFSRQQQE
mmetsp:Transcript_24709/g.44629  ORF Transcript_24709/g.44629 Transcript_24709/m.44629 type:complete len:133 (-) Transcript_24709:63-461(-)